MVEKAEREEKQITRKDQHKNKTKNKQKPKPKTKPNQKTNSMPKKILVIDDEEIVRDIAAEILNSLGYDVVTAVDGEEEVRMYQEEGGNFDLVVIDMVMPKLGGRDCFRELKKINPDVRAILSTGYGINGKAQEILDEGVMGFIQKPYSIDEFGRIVGQVISKS